MAILPEGMHLILTPCGSTRELQQVNKHGELRRVQL